MITSVSNEKCFEFRGLSSDEKPINDLIGNGAIFFEMDTDKIYMYNEENQSWDEIFAN